MRSRVGLGVCGALAAGVLVAVAVGSAAASGLVRSHAPWLGLAPSVATNSASGVGVTRRASSASPRLPVPATSDMNGDGLDDLAMYGYLSSVDPGPPWPLRVMFGKRDSGFVDVREPGSWGYILDGPFGHGASVVGDVNGDGRADILAATARRARTAPGYRTTGTVVVYGQSVTGILTAGAPGSQFRIGGRGVRLEGILPVGDVNADGYDDLGVNFRSATFRRKATADVMWLIYGRPRPVDVDVDRLGRLGVRIRAPRPPATWDSTYPTALSAVGDINGDGIDDMAVAAPWYPARSCVASEVGTRCDGRMWVIYGRRKFPRRIHVTKLGRRGLTVAPDSGRPVSQQRFTEVGYAQPAGDLDADGYDDLLVDVDMFYEPRTAAVIWGAPRTRQRRRVVVNARTSHLHGEAAPIGDFDGDGRADLLAFPDAGDYERDIYRIFLVRGHHWVGLRRIHPKRRADGHLLYRSDDFTPAPTSPVGDFNGDGFADLGRIPWAATARCSSLEALTGNGSASSIRGHALCSSASHRHRRSLDRRPGFTGAASWRSGAAALRLAVVIRRR